MRFVRRIARLVWGDDVDPALRPVLAVTLSARSRARRCGASWRSGPWTSWARRPCSRSPSWSGALLSGASGYAGGYLSDRLGRRQIILFGEGVMIGYPLVLLA